MISRLLIYSAWIATALSLRAASVKLEYMTVGAVTYSNVTIFGANATDLFFNSDHGVRNVKLKYVSPDLQKQFHYNAAGAEQIEQQQVEDNKRYQANVAAAITAQFNAVRAAREAQEQAPYAEAGLADAASSGSPIGKPAPPLKMQTWVGGQPDLEGKFAIISIWSPKSASCRKWIPALNNLRTNLPGKLEVVGVTSATEQEVSETDPKLDFPCGLDPDSKFINAAGVTMLPCVLLVDTNRIVRYEGHPAALSAGVLQEVFTNAPQQ